MDYITCKPNEPFPPHIFLVSLLIQQLRNKLGHTLFSDKYMPYLRFYQTVAMFLCLSFTKGLITDTFWDTQVLLKIWGCFQVPNMACCLSTFVNKVLLGPNPITTSFYRLALATSWFSGRAGQLHTTHSAGPARFLAPCLVQRKVGLCKRLDL